MSVLDVTRQYFELSNRRDLEKIFSMFSEDATYSSENTGLYFGLEDIRSMVTNFYSNFPYLHWEIHSIEETTPNIAEVVFTLTAKDTSGNEIIRPGIERVVVVDEELRHVEVRNSR